MDSKKTQNISNEKEAVKKERRSFLKKAAYTAPKLITLGYLSRPTSASAEYQNQGTPW